MNIILPDKTKMYISGTAYDMSLDRVVEDALCEDFTNTYRRLAIEILRSMPSRFVYYTDNFMLISPYQAMVKLLANEHLVGAAHKCLLVYSGNEF